MTNIDLNTVLERIQNALEQDDLNSAIAVLETLRLPDQADVFTELNEKQQIALLPKMDPTLSADILEELEDVEAAELVKALPTKAAIRIVDQMEPDEAADLLGDIHHEQARQILAGLENPEEVQPLLLHPDESAGGLMTSEYLALRRRMTAGEAIEAIRQWKPDVDSIYFLFVVDGQGHLSGEDYEQVWREADELRSSGELLRLAGRLQCSVVSIHGDYDPHPPDGVRVPLSGILSKFRSYTLDRCGHTPWIERYARDRFFEILEKELSGT